MASTYFKRYRMEVDLRHAPRQPINTDRDYRFIPWRPELLDFHADAKYRSFRWEIDSSVFPCLGDYSGCLQLMTQIVSRDGFLPEATWLVAYQRQPDAPLDYCGTIQGIRGRFGMGGIQNVGIVPDHRGMGLGTGLLLRAMRGFQLAGLRRAYLEVTAQNSAAVRLYRRLGFRHVRTVYKAAEIAYT